jgi:hypothetical protein
MVLSDLPGVCGGQVVLLPTALPAPLAILVAPPPQFARNSPSEPLGPLCLAMALLGETGWRPAVLDVRAWRGLRGAAHKRRLVEGLLHGWGVYLPAAVADDDDGA